MTVRFRNSRRIVEHRRQIPKALRQAAYRRSAPGFHVRR